MDVFSVYFPLNALIPYCRWQPGYATWLGRATFILWQIGFQTVNFFANFINAAKIAAAGAEAIILRERGLELEAVAYGRARAYKL